MNLMNNNLMNKCLISVPVYIDNGKLYPRRSWGTKPAPLLSEGHITPTAESGHQSFQATQPRHTFITLRAEDW